jgi:hypothetical protein
MEKHQKMAQIYGYLVCLVAVITFLICIASLISAIFDLGDTLHAAWTPDGTPSLASYENYNADILKSAPAGDEAAKTSYIPDNQTLRAMFEAAKNHKIQSVRHDSNRTIIINSILLIICFALFITHWRWMRKLAKAEA